MNWTEISDSLGHLNQPVYLYAAGSVLVLALILLLLRRRQPSSVVAYSTENGRVLVSRSAIVELVCTSCKQLNDITKPHVTIRTKGKYTHFEVRIQLLSGARLRTVEQTLQAHLRHALTENLGIENLGKIHIIANGFKSGRIVLSRPAAALIEPAQVETIEETKSDEHA
jgi:phage FluMu protein Com